MNKLSSDSFVLLSQTSVLSPMGIRQDIVNFDDKFDDEESFVVFPTDEESNTYDNDQLQFYYQQIMPQCQELIQLFSDGAESTAKEFISLMDKAICNAKDEICKEKRLPNSEGHFISVCLPSNKQKKTHGTKHYVQK